MKKIKVTTIGAGTGQATFLSALLKHTHLIDITAIVSVSDNGGHSAILRQQYGIPQVGDARQCILALAPPSTATQHYEQRTPLGHSIGNERLAELTVRHQSNARAFDEFGREVGARGAVLPVTTSVVDIAARLADGTSVVGEWQIIDRNPRLPIHELYLVPRVEAYAGSIIAVQEADYLVIASGSLRTGIVSCLLADGMHQAVRGTQAIIVFVVNLMVQPGQTDGFSVQDHLDEFARYAGRYPDYAIVNTGAIPGNLLEHYSAIGSQPVTGHISVPAVHVVHGDFIPTSDNHHMREERVGDFKKWTHALVHDGDKLARSIVSLVGIENSVRSIA